MITLICLIFYVCDMKKKCNNFYKSITSRVSISVIAYVEYYAHVVSRSLIII